MKKIILSAVICVFIAAPACSQDEQALLATLLEDCITQCEAGNSEEADELATHALEACEKLGMTESEEYAGILFILYGCKYSLGKYDETIQMGTRALKALEKLGMTESEEYALSLSVLSQCNFFLDKYDEAIQMGTRALKALEKLGMTESEEYALSLSVLSRCNFFLDKYDEAIQLGTQAREIFEELGATENLNYATVLSNLSLCNNSTHKYYDAIQLGAQAREIFEELGATENLNYALTLNNLSQSNFFLDKYDEAIQLGTQAREIFEELGATENENYAIVLSNLSLCNNSTHKYYDAIQLGAQAMEIFEELGATENLNYALTLNNLSRCNFFLDKYDEAIQLGIQAREIFEELGATENENYATVLSNLSLYNKSIGKTIGGYDMSINASEASSVGNFDEALKQQTKSLIKAKDNFGENSKYYAHELCSLAEYYALSGDPFYAIQLATRGLQVFRVNNVSEKGGFDYYRSSLEKMAFCLYAIGNYREAVKMETEVLNALDKSHDGAIYIRALTDLATYHLASGNYTEATKLAEESFEMCKGIELPEWSGCYIGAINALAVCYSKLGDYADALNMETMCLELHEKYRSNKNISYCNILSNISVFYWESGNNDEAIRIGVEALEIRERILGREHPKYATSLSNLASFYYESGNYDEAIRIGAEALEIRERILGRESPDYAMSLSNLASFYYESGNYDEAIRIGAEALEIGERTLGREHPDYATSLSKLAAYNAYMGNYAEASDYIAKATQLNSQLVLNAFSDLTGNERTLFWNKYKSWFEKNLPKLTFYFKNDSLTATMYDGTLLSKGLLLNSEIEMSKLLLESGDTAVVGTYKALQMNRAMLNKLYERPIAERYMNADSLEKVIQSQERELVQLSKVYGDYTKNLSINWKQVQEKLSDKDVAIEFLNFAAMNDRVMYVALTLTKEDNVPHLVPLFEKKELDRIDRRDCYDSSKLSELVWKPLADVLEGKENVYFAPAGELHNIAIESIPCYDGEGLMSDRWSLHRLSSTRNLALIKDKCDLKRANVYGGLTYDMSKDAIEKDSEKDTTERTMDYAVRTIASTLNLRDGVEELPATKTEAEDIDRKLEEMRISSELLTDTVGTETSFKLLSGKKSNLMHIATHGFYWTESEVKDMDNYRFLSSFDDATSPKYVEDKALTRSGLLFAGANYALQGNTVPENVNDGILTAKEISVLDLRGLDLVVLSACQTGLGEITGDGVFGLQRGFKKAGANTLMMSLWKVDDNATQMLMSKFYSNLAKGKTKHDALKDAQRYVREYEKEATVTINDNLTNFQRKQLEKEGKDVEEQTVTRTVKPYESPRFWAAFILLDGID